MSGRFGRRAPRPVEPAARRRSVLLPFALPPRRGDGRRLGVFLALLVAMAGCRSAPEAENAPPPAPVAPEAPETAGAPRAPAGPEAPAPKTPPPLPPPPPEGPEATAFDGRALFPPPLTEKVQSDREAKLASAVATYQAEPEAVESLIWVGRRLAYLGRYRHAIAIYTRGLERFPDEPRLYRHRGHRYITVRDLDRAVADLERAAQLVEGEPDRIEPDGLPNARNQPTSTLKTNIWYHLGLARFLQGDFPAAERCYRECLRHCTNPDMLCATLHWYYMTLRLGVVPLPAERAIAAVTETMDIIENHEYHRLLLLYQGKRDAEKLLEAAADGDGIQSATMGFGIGHYWLVNGEEERARELFRQIREGPMWPAFGAIAAEAELARGKTESP